MKKYSSLIFFRDTVFILLYNSNYFKFILIIFKYFRKYLKMFQNQIFQVKCFKLEIFEIFQTCPGWPDTRALWPKGWPVTD